MECVLARSFLAAFMRMLTNKKEEHMVMMDVGNRLVWQALKLYLPPGTTLMSVYRPPESQLNLIVENAKKAGYKFADTPVLARRSSWIGALEFVRSKGYKIAEPGKSLHQRWLAYDFSGPDLH